MARNKSKHARNIAPVLIMALVVIACGGAAGLWLAQSLSQQPQHVVEVRDSRRDFALIDADGAPASLATFQGKWLLMFFGFTSCPEACPLAMINVSSTLDEMGADARNVQPVFISVDPEQDTPEVIKTYLLNFDERIAGLTGTPETVAAVAKDYGVYYRKRPIEPSGYTVDHSTAFYLVSPEGNFLRAFTSDMDPAAFAQEIKTAQNTARGETR